MNLIGPGNRFPQFYKLVCRTFYFGKFSGCDCCQVCEGATRSLLQGGVTGTPEGPLGACPGGASLTLAAAAVATEFEAEAWQTLRRLSLPLSPLDIALAVAGAELPRALTPAPAAGAQPRGQWGGGRGGAAAWEGGAGARTGADGGRGVAGAGAAGLGTRGSGAGARAGRPGCSGSPPPPRHPSSILRLLAPFSSFPPLPLLLLSLSELPAPCRFFPPFPLEPRFSRSNRSVRERTETSGAVERAPQSPSPGPTWGRSLRGPRAAGGGRDSEPRPLAEVERAARKRRAGLSACPYGAGRGCWAPGPDGAVWLMAWTGQG